MRLVDAIVNKKWNGKPLEENAWYIRLENPDAIDKWKKAGKMTLLQCNELLATEEAGFVDAMAKFKGILDLIVPNASVSEDPVLWMDTAFNLKMTMRVLIKNVEDIDKLLDEVKELLKTQEVYLRVRKL